MMLFIHIAAGSIAIVSGFVALYAAKGATVHRYSGIVFVCSMVVMAILGASIAIWHGGEASFVAGLLTTYLVVTALITMRAPSARLLLFGKGAMVIAFALGIVSTGLAVDAVRLGGVREGIPAVVLFKFAIIALIGAFSDVRIMRTGQLQGRRRLARHMWRMCFALYIASASFFLGQADKLPEVVRTPVLLAIPVLAPIIAIFYWFWRLRRKRSSIAAFTTRARLESMQGVSAD